MSKEENSEIKVGAIGPFIRIGSHRMPVADIKAYGVDDGYFYVLLGDSRIGIDFHKPDKLAELVDEVLNHRLDSSSDGCSCSCG